MDEMANMEKRLSATLRAELASQKGRALAAFRAEVNRPVLAYAPARRRWWVWGVMGAAAVFMMVVGLVAVVFVAMRPSSPTGPTALATMPMMGPRLVIEQPVEHVEQVVWERNVDGGVQVIGDRPMKMIRRQQIEHTQWLDADNAVMTRTRPREEIRFITAQPY